MNISLLMEKIKLTSDKELVEGIAEGGLQLTKEQIQDVSFAFWMVYMAEVDLNASIQDANNSMKVQLSPDEYQRFISLLSSIVNDIKQDQCPQCGHLVAVNQIDIENPAFFRDKIKIYESFFGKNRMARLLWKLNDIRNALSHNRISELSYKGQSLKLRSTKEKLIEDYFSSLEEFDVSKSPVWPLFTKDQQTEILRAVGEI